MMSLQSRKKYRREGNEYFSSKTVLIREGKEWQRQCAWCSLACQSAHEHVDMIEEKRKTQKADTARITALREKKGA